MADVNQDVNLSSLDKVRRLFGMPTLLQQMQAQKQQAAAAQTGVTAQTVIPQQRTASFALQERQSALDAAAEELRMQQVIRQHNAGR